MFKYIHVSIYSSQNNREKCKFLLNIRNDIGLEVNIGKTNYMEVGRHRGKSAYHSS